MTTSAETDAILEKVPIFTAKLNEVCQENLRAAESDAPYTVLAANRLAWAATVSMIRRFEKKPVKIPRDKEAFFHHRWVLAVSFLQGIHLCYQAIGNGLYIQACALLRQEMETIAAMVETRRSGKVEKVTGRGQQVGKGNIAWQMNRLHGALSSASHLTDPELLDGLYRSVAKPEEGLSGRPVRLMPLYSKGDAMNMWADQAGLILQLFDEINQLLKDLYSEGANGAEIHVWNAAFQSLSEAGFLVVEDPGRL